MGISAAVVILKQYTVYSDIDSVGSNLRQMSYGCSLYDLAGYLTLETYLVEMEQNSEIRQAVYVLWGHKY